MYANCSLQDADLLSRVYLSEHMCYCCYVFSAPEIFWLWLFGLYAEPVCFCPRRYTCWDTVLRHMQSLCHCVPPLSSFLDAFEDKMPGQMDLSCDAAWSKPCAPLRTRLPTAVHQTFPWHPHISICKVYQGRSLGVTRAFSRNTKTWTARTRH